MSKESIITDWPEFCLICGAKAEHTHHAIPGTANRAKSDRYGLLMPLCANCHDMSRDSIHKNPKMASMSKIIGQLAYERDAAIMYCLTSDSIREDNAIHLKELVEQTIRDSFVKEFGKSFV